MSGTATIQLRLSVQDPSLGSNELDDLVRGIRRDLLNTKVEEVQRVTVKAEQGARTGGIVEIPLLIVILAPRLLRPVTDLLKEWLKDRAERSITVELGADKIELKGSSRDEQHRLIDEFIRAHSNLQPPGE